jgi:FAD/FMN-containing dehydrogenase/dTDP-4-amino-4,6-dideoxygalactose transaminase
MPHFTSMALRKLLLYPRKQLDIRWRDLAAAMLRCLFPGDAAKSEAQICRTFAPDRPVLVAFAARAGFDLFLKAQAWPAGSEILMSALTIREMADIARKHDLVPVPLDLNLSKLAPEVSAMEAAITPRTRAVVIAHLFGSRVDMDPFIAVAKRRGLLVLEDCAQAFTGMDYTGHPETDAAMFSFGSIKTATALVGAVIVMKDAQLLEKMRWLQRGYSVQSRKEYFQLALTHVLVKLFTIPPLYGLFYGACVWLEKDFDQVINAVRNLPPEDEEEDLALIRKQPSAPLLALLLRRLRTFSTQRLRERREVGRQFARGLPAGMVCLGSEADFHSYWVFPVLVEAPERFAAALRTYGFDATTAGSALSVIAPPPDGKFPAPENLRAAHRKLLYLPVYPEVSTRARARLQSALHKIQKETPHLRMVDARRVYSASVGTIDSPRTISGIREVLEQASKRDQPVCLMGTTHNLGGHAFLDGAVALDLKRFDRVVSFDVVGKRITVQSGITWEKIQNIINSSGLAVKAMQSDNNFTVGGSLSANAHGRDLQFSTVIQSVLGFRIMLADGSVVHASRSENTELFRLAIGGYGMFGIILEVDLELVENSVYEQSSEIMPLASLPEYFGRKVQGDPLAKLFIARPSIASKGFLDDTIVTKWRLTPARPKNIFRLDHERNVRRDRFLFALSRKYSRGKTLRWHAEKFISAHPSGGGFVSRNNAMRPPVSAIKMFDYHSPVDTDIIQEFFVPIPRFLSFMESARSVLRESGTNLLGLTIRYVVRDSESFLSYAPLEEALAVVLYINEQLSPEGWSKSSMLTQRLIRLATQNGGTFYLTYAREVEPDDLRRAYTNMDAFFYKKHQFDPENRFTSRFFEYYRPHFLTRRVAASD